MLSTPSTATIVGVSLYKHAMPNAGAYAPAEGRPYVARQVFMRRHRSLKWLKGSEREKEATNGTTRRNWHRAKSATHPFVRVDGNLIHEGNGRISTESTGCFTVHL